MDDELKSVYYSIGDIMKLLKRSRAQVDRYRTLPGFPTAIIPSGARSGGKLYLRSEVNEWLKSRQLAGRPTPEPLH